MRMVFGTSVALVAAGNTTCPWPALPKGYDVRGNAENYPAATSADECCQACDASDSCAAWIWRQVTPSQVMCNLKQTVGESYNCGEDVCLAGALKPPPAPQKCPGGGAPSQVGGVGNGAFRHLEYQVEDGEEVPPARAAALLNGEVQPHVFIFLQDDLGHDDVAFYGNNVNLDVTGNITAAANEGVILDRHYVHWHCSPTRRSVLTGRLPLHHSEYLSDIGQGDDIDLRWQTIGHKMRDAGYATHWFGKGHTGYKSWNHLPQQLGFDDFVGFLGGAQDHFSPDRWGTISRCRDVWGFHMLVSAMSF